MTKKWDVRELIRRAFCIILNLIWWLLFRIPVSHVQENGYRMDAVGF